MDSDFLPMRRKKKLKQKPLHQPMPVETVHPTEKVKELSLAEPAAPLVDEKPIDLPTTPTDGPKPPKKKRRNPLQWFKSLSKKKKIIVIIALVFLLSGVVAGAWFVFLKPKPEPPKPVAAVQPKPEPPKPTTEPSKLTGVEVKIEMNQRPVTAIMIENSPDARPQSGLKEAGVVFEAIAEGGITRFLTLFQEAQPDDIGPVRSVRPYYIDWLHGFDAAVAHVGGSSDGLAKIKAEGIKDLDQFANPAPFRRVSHRYAPHNMYTSMAGLDELSKSKGFTSSKFDGFPRKKEKAITPAQAVSIDFNISGYLYNPHYDYDAATNTYKRSEGGKIHTDAKSGEQLAPKVVIAMVVPYGIAANRVNSTYATIGSGKAYVFQDGAKIEGTWSKASGAAQVTFVSADGKPIELNPGQTWISVVGSADRVTSK